MRRRPLVLLTTGLLSVSALSASLLPGAAAAESAGLLRPLVGPEAGGFPGAEVALGDLDRRGPALPPLASAVAAVRALGATASYNQYGTPRTLTRPGGVLATVDGGSAEARARGFLRAHAGLTGLSLAQLDALDLVSVAPLRGSDASAVLLRQRVRGVELAQDGQVVVGVRGDGAVVSLTSSLVPSAVLGDLASTTPEQSAAQAVLAAARDAGLADLALGDLAVGRVDGAGFTTVVAKGVAQAQRARLRALPTTDRGVRLVWETAVQDVAGSRALAAISFVDAQTGQVLKRSDAVDTAWAGGVRSQAAPSGGPISGTYSVDACSEPVPLSVPAGTRSISVLAAAVNPANDITVKINRGSTTVIEGDLLTSPEVVTANLTPAAAQGEAFTTQVCPFDDTSTAPFTFVGSYVTSAQAVTVPPLPSVLLPAAGAQAPATWRVFPSNPTLPRSAAASPDDRTKVCSGAPGQTTSKDLTGCTFTFTDASPLPYDVEGTTGLPTSTTAGNNAITTNAQASTSLTPGAPLVSPVSPTRDLAPAFGDSWHTSGCDPFSIADPTRRADVDAAIVNLFVGHNRAHDFAYLLGLTETTGALQVNNFGKGGAEGDPELGNAQNAALTSQVVEGATAEAPIGLTGRNNANQITLQDGVPGITNQYLFQPVLGFYGPCADGDLDGSIFLHEYGHAISNRLVAGPEVGLSGEQAGAMGESWADLVALEYLQAFGLAGKRGEDPFSVGAYATGDAVEGIRDYNLHPDRNPLTYAEYGFDSTGPEVHADGEIWNAANTVVRAALMARHRSAADPSDAALQEACATGRTRSGAPHSTFAGCPGNRRWVTYLFDAMLLQASGEPTMVDQKDLMLAADVLRKGGDSRVMAKAFATRGLGSGARSATNEDTDPTPSFAAPVAADNARVTFRLVDAVTGAPVKGSVHAGTYQARTTPVATTLGGKAPAPTTTLTTGAHRFVVQAPGYGLQRFTQTYAAGSTTTTFRLQQNLASAARGATAAGEGVRMSQVIDDDEATNGGFSGAPVAGRTLTVDLAGARSTVRRIAVSALHHPVDPEDPEDFQGRLLGLRAFDLQASQDGGRTFRTVYRSAADFFPGDRPRPVAPDLQLRAVDLPAPVTATHLRLVVRSNQCTGGPDFRGEQENDPTSESDCPSTPFAEQVTVTELQAFGTAARAVAAAPGTGTGTGTGSGLEPVGGRLPATGAPAALGLAALLLLGGAAVVRRRALG